MAFSNRGTNLPGIAAGVDLSAQQHRFIIINSSGAAVVAGDGVQIDGVLENNPVLGGAVTIMGPGSVAKVVAGGAITQGDAVASDGSGAADVATIAEYIVGRALNTAAVGELVSVWITMPGRAA